MKLYELTYLISPDISEEELKNIQEKIDSFLREIGGDLKKKQNPRKIELGYPIKKKGSAYLGGLTFNLAPEKIENLKEKLLTLSEILRFFCTVKKIFPEKLPSIKSIVKKPITDKQPAKKVELKKIEEKLEEILGE